MFQKGEIYLAKLTYKEMLEIDKQVKLVLDIKV